MSARTVKTYEPVSQTENNDEQQKATSSKEEYIITSDENTPVTCSNSNLHSPWGSPETAHMRYIAILFIIIFGTVLLFLKFLVSLCATSIDYYPRKCFQRLSEETSFILIAISSFTILYICSAFDLVQINWQFMVAGLFLFILLLYFFFSIIVLLSSLIVQKWTELDKYAVSFSKLSLI